MRVFLFDIDGTLLNTGGAGRAALESALAEEFGITTPAQIPLGGRTDRGIAGHLFQLHGIADSDPNWERFRGAYLRWLANHLPQRTGRVFPGVCELLNRLVGQPGIVVGLLTGNVREGARLKLTHFGLERFFFELPTHVLGGFGDQHAERENVASDALRAVESHLQGDAICELWVIGDTPADVRCGRHIGAKTVAVTTGTHRRDELAAERPDLLLDELTAWSVP